MTIEHQTDEAHRRAQAGILTFSGDFKQLHLLIAIADNLEEAADALMRSVLAAARLHPGRSPARGEEGRRHHAVTRGELGNDLYVFGCGAAASPRRDRRGRRQQGGRT